MWITENEPWPSAYLGYETGVFAPGKLSQGYSAAHNMILSHGRVYRLYQSKYKDQQNGEVGITLSHTNGVPYNPESSGDVEAAERWNQGELGWFANPIFGNGDYPDVMKWQVGNKSREQGLPESRLPAFTEEEKLMLKGSGDFLGYNMYTSDRIKASLNPLEPVSIASDLDLVVDKDPTWPTSGSSWLRVTPWGLRQGLNWVRDHYGNVTMYVTENGVSDNTGTLEDQPRIDFYRAYLDEVLKAIKLDGCDVRGYTAWSFLDNFEWMRGYSEHFGLHYVNFSDPERPRTPKASARFYTSIIENNGFVRPGVGLASTTLQPPTTSVEIIKIDNNRNKHVTGDSSKPAISIAVCIGALMLYIFN